MRPHLLLADDGVVEGRAGRPRPPPDRPLRFHGACQRQSRHQRYPHDPSHAGCREGPGVQCDRAVYRGIRTWLPLKTFSAVLAFPRYEPAPKVLAVCVEALAGSGGSREGLEAKMARARCEREASVAGLPTPSPSYTTGQTQVLAPDCSFTPHAL
jgi:hypothetical protein